MKLKITQLDAFADRLFGGNPAEICALESFLEDPLLQQIESLVIEV